jgi:hypothetical protein
MSEVQTKSGSGAMAVRIAVGAHVAGVGVCALLSIIDSSSMILPADHSLRRLAVGALLAPALLAFIACPIIVLTVALRRGTSRQTTYSILAELALCLAQCFALLPGYQ